MTELNKRIEKFIDEHHVLTLATCTDNESWCCNCFYTFLSSEKAFIFTSDDDTKHILMGLENPQVSGSVVLETSTVGKIRGIQFTGKLIKVDSSEKSKYRLQYLKKFPFAVLVNTSLWIIKVELIKMTDNRLGFGKKIYWENTENEN